MKGLAQSPFVLPQPIRGRREEEHRGGTESWAFQTRPTPRAREGCGHWGRRQDKLFLCSSHKEDWFLRRGEEKRKRRPPPPPAQRRSRSRASVCTLLSPTKGRGTLPLTQEKGSLTLTADDTDPQADLQRAAVTQLLGLSDNNSCFFCEHLLNAKHWHFRYPESEAQRG